MGICYENLDRSVRDLMVSELKLDVANGKLYLSQRLTDAGAQVWPQVLQEACEQHDDVWIAEVLRSNGYIRPQEPRRTPSGGITMVKVPYTAPETLAEGEFNRLYARGLCANVLASGGTHVQVYRGKEVENPRSASQAMIGQLVPAATLLEDLRTAQGVDTALGLPAGPNSGLTVRQARIPARAD